MFQRRTAALAVLALMAGSSELSQGQSGAPVAATGGPAPASVIALPRGAHRTGVGRTVRTQAHAVPVAAAPSRTVIVPPGEEVTLTPVYPIHYPVPIYITPPLHGRYVPPYYLPPAYYYAWPAGHVPVANASATGPELEAAAAAAAGAGAGPSPAQVMEERTESFRSTMVEESIDK